MNKLLVYIAVSFAAVVILFDSAFAWGPLTHMALALDSYQASGLNYDEKQMAAFLAGAVEPDIGVELGGDMREHSMIYQDADFVKAMINVAGRKKSPEKEILMARARGYALHLLTDSVAHKADLVDPAGYGYPNSKKVFEKGSSHGVVELCVDFLTYRQKKYSETIDSIKPDYMDVNTIIEVRNEFASIKNIELKSDPAVINKQSLKLQATAELEKVLTRSLSDERIAQMDVFFNDRHNGVNDNLLALDTSRKLALEKIDNPYDFFGAYNETTAAAQKKYPAASGDSLLFAAYNLCLDKISGVLSFVSGSDSLVNTLQRIANERLFKKNDETKKIATFIKNILADQCVSFEECIYLAEKECGESVDLEKERRFLSVKLENAKIKYQSRPWWRIDYLITNADYNEYIKLENEYADLIKRQAGESSNVSQGSAVISSGENISRAAGVEDEETAAAYRKMTAAYRTYVQNGLKNEDFIVYNEANEEYNKILSRRNCGVNEE